MEIRVTTRDDVMYVVDSDDQDDALNAFLGASDEEWVRVVPAALRSNPLFVRRSEIKLVAAVEDEVVVDDAVPPPDADETGETDETDKIF